MALCGATTKKGKKCRRLVAKAGTRCHEHSRTNVRTVISKIYKVCTVIADIGGKAQGIQWIYETAWPFVQPLFDQGLFCPESFWWDSLAHPVQKGESAAEIRSKLRRELAKLRTDEERIEERLAHHRPRELDLIANAYSNVWTAIRAEYPHLGNTAWGSA